MFIPGAMEPVGGDGLGAAVVAVAGVGVGFFTGAGVAMGMPGIGAMVDCAAIPGDTVSRVKTAATLKRMASKQTSRCAAAYYAP
jgi:hypothetical protein